MPSYRIDTATHRTGFRIIVLSSIVRHPATPPEDDSHSEQRRQFDRWRIAAEATTAQIGGAIIMVAGIYQLTSLKDVCLSKCRKPMDFIVTSWRDGAKSAFEMGLLYGAYCLGCCWLLFVMLFPLGINNVGAMAAVTLIIFAEKTLPWPRLAPYTAAVALVLYGALVIASPQLLPTFQEDGGAAVQMKMSEK